MRTSSMLSFLSLAGLVACIGGERAGAGGETGGTVIVAAIAEPAALLPQAMSSTVEKQIVDQIFDYLAEIGPDINTVGDKGWIPRLADSWSWSRDSLSIAFHLNPRARWHDGPPVRASDVKFSLDLFKDPKVRSIAASNLDNIDSVSAADSLTAVVWYRRRSPEQFQQIAYNLIVTPEHLLKDSDRTNLAASEFAHHPVGSGPFRFVSWTPRREIEIEADTTYFRGRPKLDRVIWSLSQDATAAATRVLSGEADLLELTPLEVMTEAASVPNVRSLPYRSINYGYVVFNQRDAKDGARAHPLFGDRAMRHALSMALDRDAMRKNVFDSLGVVALGPFSRFYPTADTTVPQIRYDTTLAGRMLDSLGWRDTNADGIRDKNGAPLRFSLMVPNSSIARRRYAVLLQEQWRRVGVAVDIEELDAQAMGPRMFGGKFDAFINVWSSDPSPSALRQSWRSGSRDDGNFASYANRQVDAVLDSAVAEFDPRKSQALYRRAYRLIVDDVPAVWLYETRNRALIHARLQPVVDGADIWWRDLRLWSIPSGARIERDKVGLVARSK